MLPVEIKISQNECLTLHSTGTSPMSRSVCRMSKRPSVTRFPLKVPLSTCPSRRVMRACPFSRTSAVPSMMQAHVVPSTGFCSVRRMDWSNGPTGATITSRLSSGVLSSTTLGRPNRPLVYPPVYQAPPCIGADRCGGRHQGGINRFIFFARSETEWHQKE